ncbi:hypothetical protein M878_42300 [Streptomyces roseochromogenus subsp. oscitans DS 12.976]|uniref:PE-PGRS family protein n=1 Tax=Streptomyces roseochromogenus subsp. oscitans DS 12.976 TaxID=1352936 RepID=V6JJG8_STRRC|nr:hypothetical protein M878_42300 [Streptomyces roseochromogenus subsp. oscitans DS 12.976]
MFAAVCVVLAALGHVLMSGRDVPAWAWATGLVATGAVGWCLTGRERGPRLIVPLVVVAQTALHSAFSLAQSASGSTPPMASGHAGTAIHMGMGDMGSMSIGSMGSMDSMDMGHMGHTSMNPLQHMGHSLGAGDASSSGMAAAHLLAALLTGLWLAYGEKAAFRILRAAAGRLAAPLRLLLALPLAGERPDQRLCRPRSDRAPSLDLLIHAITSRGPPVGTAVA